jgi:hypothetical protein
MYYSIIENGRFYVYESDGVAEQAIMEFPNEDMADEVAFHLQMAWNDGESWGKNEMKKSLDPEGYRKEIDEAFKKVRGMSDIEQKTHIANITQLLEKQRNEVRKQVMHLKR